MKQLTYTDRCSAQAKLSCSTLTDHHSQPYICNTSTNNNITQALLFE